MSTTHKFIGNLVKKHFGDRKISIIDYGCGNGFFIDYLDTNQIKKYTGYDVSDDCLISARKNHKNKKYIFNKIHKNKIQSLGKNKIDLFSLIGVIQYMSNSELNYFFKEVKRLLNDNGLIIFSCTADHLPYRLFNIYQLITPNNFINRKFIINKMKHFGLIPILQTEKGLLIAPFFSNILSLFFDSFDRLILGVRGRIGPVGKIARTIIKPLIWVEHQLPIDYGYTLYIVGKKK